MLISKSLTGASLAALFIATPALAGTADVAPAQAPDQTAPAPAPAPAPAAGESTHANGGGVQDIVVTARRVSESVQKVPLAITVLGSQDLADTSVRNVRDLQGLAPSLYIASGSGGPSAANIAIRGQTQADTLLTTDPSVAVYLNEINLPRQIGLRSAFLDVDQVEVLKGPQGTLFGKNTTGGALLLRTKRPDLSEAGGFAQSVIGNFGTLQLSGALGVPIIDGVLGVRVAGQISSRDGFAKNGIGQDLGDQFDRSGRVSILAEPSANLKIFLTGDYTKSDSNGSLAAISYINPLGFDATGTPTGFLANGLKQALAQQGLPRTVANYTAAYNRLVAETVGRPDVLRTSGVEPVFAHLEIYGFSSDISLDLGDVTLRSITGYRHTARNDQQDYDQSEFQLVRPRNFVYSKQFTQEAQIIGKFGPLEVIGGGFYSYENGYEGSETKQIGLINPGSPSFANYYITNKSYAGFIQANYAITDKLKLTGGFRYSKITQDADIRNSQANGCVVPIVIRVSPTVCSAVEHLSSAKPSYLASLDYQVTPSVLVYAKTSSSFRGGGFNVRGGTATGINVYTPFAPEVATDYEVGFKGDLFDRKVRLNIAAYDTEYTGVQKSTLTVVDNTLITVVSNAASARIYGGEAELTVRPVPEFTFNGTAGWTHARYVKFIEANGNNRTKEPFPVPEWQYTLSGKYDVPVGDGQLSLYSAWRWQSNVAFRGTAINQPSTSQAAYGLLEGRLSYQFGDKPGLEVAVFGKNLTNKIYRTNALDFDASLGYNLVFIGDPRTYGVELKIAFGGK